MAQGVFQEGRALWQGRAALKSRTEEAEGGHMYREKAAGRGKGVCNAMEWM